MVLVWGACRKTLAEPRKSDETEAIDQAARAYKTELPDASYEKRDWRIPIELTPIDQTFTLIARSHKRKSAEFIPLIRVASLSDTKDVNPEHIRIRWTSGDFVLVPPRTTARKNTDFNRSYESFTRSIKIIMCGYVLAARSDPEWKCGARCNLLPITLQRSRYTRARARASSKRYAREWPGRK